VTKRDARPPAPVVQPVDRHGLAAALRLFVTGFVVADKREQMHKRLLAAERRGETLAALPRWIEGTHVTLEGADRSPAGLQARFGELLGVHLDTDGARRTTIAGALALGRARSSLFVGDAGRIAMITVEAGAPILCSR
jgi:phage-related minor tail protein